MKQKPSNVAASVSDDETLRIWREGVWRFVRSVAKHEYHRLSALAQEQQQEGFNSAAENYVHVMWQWVMNQTPDYLLTTINTLESPAPSNPVEARNRKLGATQLVLHYLLHRTIFLEGLEHGQAHRAEWYRRNVSLFAKADRLNDMDIFRALASAKQKRESKKPRPGWGHLRFRILLTWLAGGLWRLPNDGERCKVLNELWLGSGSENATEEGFKTARQALDL